MKKRLNIEIEGTCKSCPFCKYNLYYILGEDVGYDCEFPGSKVSRVVNGEEVRNNFNSKTNGWPSIPDKCPLQTIEEHPMSKGD